MDGDGVELHGEVTSNEMLSRVQLFAAPWTVARQAALSMEFSRQESLPFPSQGIFPNQGLNLGLLHYRQILYHLTHQWSPASNETSLE